MGAALKRCCLPVENGTTSTAPPSAETLSFFMVGWGALRTCLVHGRWLPTIITYRYPW